MIVSDVIGYYLLRLIWSKLNCIFNVLIELIGIELKLDWLILIAVVWTILFHKTQTVSGDWKIGLEFLMIGKLLGTSFSRNIIVETVITITNLREKLKLVIVIVNQLC